MDDKEIIRQLVAKAKEAQGIFYDSVDGTEEVAADFTSMSDEQIEKFLDSHGMDVKMAALDGIENYWPILSQKIIDNVTYDTQADYTNQPNWNGRIGRYESKKHKKFSSFKNQQTITENFRRFLKK